MLSKQRWQLILELFCSCCHGDSFGIHWRTVSLCFQHMQQYFQFQGGTCFCSLMNLKCPHWPLVWKTLVSMNLGREALSLGSLWTPFFFLVEQQSGQPSLCHIDARSVLELWLGFPVLTKCLYKGPFVQRPPGPFCCPAFQDHSKTCFHWDVFVPSVSPGLCVPCQPGMTFLLCCFSVFCPHLCCCLQDSVWKVNTVHPARCPSVSMRYLWRHQKLLKHLQRSTNKVIVEARPWSRCCHWNTLLF